MKICVISSCVLPCPPAGYAGLEMIVWQCARGLAELGHDVTLIAPEGSSCPNCKVINCGKPGQWDESHAFRTYASHLMEANYDAIIDHSWSKFSLSHKPYLKAPVLCVMHAPINGMLQSLPPNTDKPCFVCISQDQANHFDALFNYKPRVCHNGIDLSFYKDTQVSRTDRFLFLARFSRIKGATIAQDVCRACNVPLDLVGDTTITGEPDYLQECIRKADGNLIRIIGPATRSDCVHWMSRGRALIHLNKYFREPFGLAPVEAQACGMGVLAWSFGAMSETVKHGETGFLVRSEQEAIDVIKSGELDRIDRNRCREWASQFSIQNMVRRYESLCQEAIETGGW